MITCRSSTFRSDAKVHVRLTVITFFILAVVGFIAWQHEVPLIHFGGAEAIAESANSLWQTGSLSAPAFWETYHLLLAESANCECKTSTLKGSCPAAFTPLVEFFCLYIVGAPFVGVKFRTLGPEFGADSVYRKCILQQVSPSAHEGAARVDGHVRLLEKQCYAVSAAREILYSALVSTARLTDRKLPD